MEKGGKEFKQVEQDETRKNEVGFWLDRYPDLFSDFDHRVYSQRSLSFDFLSELRRATREIKEEVKLKFYVHKEMRNKESEQLIKGRLVDHFKKHYGLLAREKSGVIKMGLLFIAVGIVLMFGAAYLLFSGGHGSIFLSFALILLEPSGWFLFWEGLNLVIFESKKINPELEFYEKMHAGSIYFFSY